MTIEKDRILKCYSQEEGYVHSSSPLLNFAHPTNTEGASIFQSNDPIVIDCTDRIHEDENAINSPLPTPPRSSIDTALTLPRLDYDQADYDEDKFDNNPDLNEREHEPFRPISSPFPATSTPSSSQSIAMSMSVSMSMSMSVSMVAGSCNSTTLTKQHHTFLDDHHRKLQKHLFKLHTDDAIDDQQESKHFSATESKEGSQQNHFLQNIQIEKSLSLQRTVCQYKDYSVEKAEDLEEMDPLPPSLQTETEYCKNFPSNFVMSRGNQQYDDIEKYETHWKNLSSSSTENKYPSTQNKNVDVISNESQRLNAFVRDDSPSSLEHALTSLSTRNGNDQVNSFEKVDWNVAPSFTVCEGSSFGSQSSDEDLELSMEFEKMVDSLSNSSSIYAYTTDIPRINLDEEETKYHDPDNNKTSSIDDDLKTQKIRLLETVTSKSTHITNKLECETRNGNIDDQAVKNTKSIEKAKSKGTKRHGFQQVMTTRKQRKSYPQPENRATSNENIVPVERKSDRNDENDDISLNRASSHNLHNLTMRKSGSILEKLNQNQITTIPSLNIRDQNYNSISVLTANINTSTVPPEPQRFNCNLITTSSPKRVCSPSSSTPTISILSPTSTPANSPLLSNLRYISATSSVIKPEVEKSLRPVKTITATTPVPASMSATISRARENEVLSCGDSRRKSENELRNGRSSSSPGPSVAMPSSTPSRFCHICTRATNPDEVEACGNLRKGMCRKVICHRCLKSMLVDWKSQIRGKHWECTHCRKSCPRRAQCFTYKRVNQNRRADTRRGKRLSSPKNGTISPSATRLPLSKKDKVGNLGKNKRRFEKNKLLEAGKRWTRENRMDDVEGIEAYGSKIDEKGKR